MVETTMAHAEAPVRSEPRPESLLDRLLRRRDRLVSSPAFQRWAARFPFTRRVAHARARDLFDLVAGFTYSQVLLACVRLDLFDRLFDGPATADTLARECELPLSSMERLLSAAVALRLVEPRSGGRYGLGALGAPLARNEAIASMVLHHAALYADLADPVALLRHPPGSDHATRLGAYWGYAGTPGAADLDGTRVADYSALMSASQPLVTDEVLAAYPFARHRRLLDVGGGEATFAIAAAKRVPSLSCVVFDLPAVVARAQERIAEAGLGARITATGGDFARDALPHGADLATLVRVIHDHDDDVAMNVLRAVRAALPDDGVLLLAEPMAGTPGAERMGDAYFGIYLLAMGSGRPRSAEVLRRMLLAAGFATTRLLPTALPLQVRVIAASGRRPATPERAAGATSAPHRQF